LHWHTINHNLTPNKHVRDYLPGSIADRGMRWWLSGDPKPGLLVPRVLEMYDRLTNPDLGDDEYRPFTWKGNPQEDQQKVRDFLVKVATELEPILLKWVVPYDYDPEHRFRVVVGLPYLDERTVAVTMIGGIDIVVRIPDGRFILFDLKATVNDSYIAQTLGQGIFYDVAWKFYWGEHPVKFGFIAPALEDKLIWVDITPDDRRLMMDRIVRFAQGMWRGEWEPKEDNNGCQWCEAKNVCDKFAMHLTIDDQGKRRAAFENAVQTRRTVPADTEGRHGDG
jgi:hypothetical protein